MRIGARLGIALGIGWLAAACTTDMNIGDWIKPNPFPGGTDPGSGSSGSGSSGSGSSGSGSSGSAGTSGMPTCGEEEQGGPTSCKDAGTWKLYATQACEGQGLALTDYIPYEECGQGVYRYVSYTCCPPVTPPDPCVQAEQGSPTSCKDVATWKQYAGQSCEEQGLTLSAYTPREECGGGAYRYVDYICCPSATPPKACVDEVQGGPTSCKDVGTWKQYAGEACAGHGLNLSNYVPREECGDGAYRYVDYICCP